MAQRTTARKKQFFRISQSDAQRVLLVGDFTNWEQRAILMQKGMDGVWAATVILPPGAHQYLFIVDGKWCEDPECALRVANPHGGFNMVRQVE